MSLRSEIKSYQSSQQLNWLILIKSAQNSSLHEVAEHLGVHNSSIQRWLKDYKENGIQSLLSPQTRNKPSKIFTPEMHLVIEEKLKRKDNPFSWYVKVQEWLKKEFHTEQIWLYIKKRRNNKTFHNMSELKDWLNNIVSNMDNSLIKSICWIHRYNEIICSTLLKNWYNLLNKTHWKIILSSNRIYEAIVNWIQIEKLLFKN